MKTIFSIFRKDSKLVRELKSKIIGLENENLEFTYTCNDYVREIEQLKKDLECVKKQLSYLERLTGVSIEHIHDIDCNFHELGLNASYADSYDTRKRENERIEELRNEFAQEMKVNLSRNWKEVTI